MEAVELAERHKNSIDLLLTDVVMPKVNGPELAQRLCVARPAMKTLYMAGYAERVTAHHDVLSSDTIFLEKPFSLHRLAGKVREALNTHVLAH